MVAIQTAVLIPESVRRNNDLGAIVLTSSESWVEPDPESVFLGGGDASISGKMVHSELQADPDTLSALRELGIRRVSPEIAFKEAVSAWTPWQSNFLKGYLSPRGYYNRENTNIDWSVFSTLDPDTIQKGLKSFSAHNDVSGLRILYSLLNDGYTVRPDYAVWMDKYWSMFWPFARDVDSRAAARIIRESKHDWRNVLKVRTVDGGWRPLFNILLPGPIVPEDGSRDAHIAVDVQFHQDDLDLLKELGAIGSPRGGHKLSAHRYNALLSQCRRGFQGQEGLMRRPREHMLNFTTTVTSGPLDVLESLSHEAKAEYTWRLLDLPDTYKPWTMSHDTQDIYPAMNFPSPALETLRKNGRIRMDDGIHKLSDGLGDPPLNPAVREKLLSHPQADLIRRAFQIPDAETPPDDDYDYYTTTDKIKAARDVVRRYSTDEMRLLAAVGEMELRRRLPEGLIKILEADNNGPLNGIQVAQAAIATYHTGALREYRDSLGHLDPPRRWAGSPGAVAFVKSLGFSEEWAMERNSRRDPYIEVEGPYSLPSLHDYQCSIVNEVRGLIRSGGELGERRGMISMPTGSGKTRVAVQSIVEAMREDGFEGGILWVADRDELCEQAVEAWRQVWASEGIQRTQLRISRMWEGQPAPLPAAQMHVIVATIQTLSAKINNQPDAYEFLSDFKLLVFDEAHRSVAPTFTSVMVELGLTRWRRGDEPLLIGLTATPYKGYDERETARLVNRYGQNRLDAGAFKSDDPEDVIRELQDMRVLAHADHGTIEGGSFSLSSSEMRLSQAVPWLPQSVENRIAQDTDRTRRIVKAYREKIDPNAPTLIFATSVEHSQVLAALLTSMGVSARAVSADTDRYTRRRIVEEFRAGEIRVLVNYGIFREGFDAPKTRAIIVARPVYSPNLYFQMIGRGLRGVKNGGNDRCLILNVRDNIENFQRKLAFSELDWLWD